jgi:hypothetical protein
VTRRWGYLAACWCVTGAGRLPATVGPQETTWSVRADVELPELYLLLVGMSRAAARTDVDDEVRTRALAIVFDGLTRPQGGV